MIQNIDRVPVNVAPNGAIKHGVYDAAGKLIRYEYIRREDGAAVSGTIMNKLKLDEMLAASGTTGGTSEALTLAQAGFVLADGALVRFKLHTASGPMPTINVNSTGAKDIKTLRGKPMRAGTPAGVWITVVYSAADGNFTLQGEGGDAPVEDFWKHFLTNSMGMRGW